MGFAPTVSHPFTMKLPLCLLSLLFLAALALPGRAAVVINEIMYHPASELDADEWIELYNNGAAAVDVSGWKFTSGVNFTFPVEARENRQTRPSRRSFPGRCSHGCLQR